MLQFNRQLLTFGVVCGAIGLYFVSAYITVFIVVIAVCIYLYQIHFVGLHPLQDHTVAIRTVFSSFRSWINSLLATIMKGYQQPKPVVLKLVRTNVPSYSVGNTSQLSPTSRMSYGRNRYPCFDENSDYMNRRNGFSTYSVSAPNCNTFDSSNCSENKTVSDGRNELQESLSTSRCSYGVDSNISAKNSPWGKNVSSYLRDNTINLKTVQTVAGPLLASTRFNKNNSIDLGLYVDVNSPGLTSRMVQYGEESGLANGNILTHQPQYVSPGQFPLVQLNRSASKLPMLSPRNSQKFSKTPVRVKIAPPDYVGSRLFTLSDRNHILHSNSVQSNHSTKSVIETLKEISRKRIHSQLDDDEDDEVKRQRKSESGFSTVGELMDTLPNGDVVNNESHVKRAREESPKQDTRLVQHPSKRVRNNEILSSLSSSNVLLHGGGIKRKKTSLDWSRSSTPVLGKQLKTAAYSPAGSLNNSITITPLSTVDKETNTEPVAVDTPALPASQVSKRITPQANGTVRGSIVDSEVYLSPIWSRAGDAKTNLERNHIPETRLQRHIVDDIHAIEEHRKGLGSKLLAMIEVLDSTEYAFGTPEEASDTTPPVPATAFPAVCLSTATVTTSVLPVIPSSTAETSRDKHVSFASNLICGPTLLASRIVNDTGDAESLSDYSAAIAWAPTVPLTPPITPVSQTLQNVSKPEISFCFPITCSPKSVLQDTNTHTNTTSSTTSAMSFGLTSLTSPAAIPTPSTQNDLTFGFKISSVQNTACEFSIPTSEPNKPEIGFGTISSNTPSQVGFDSAANTTIPSQSVFGVAETTTTPSQNVFGTAANTTTPSQSVFGTAANSTTPSQNGTATNTMMSSQSEFGNATNLTMPSPAMFGVVANTTTPSQSLFGGATNTTTPSQSMFGGATNTTPSQSMFGSATNTTTPSQSMFGSATITTTPSQGVFGSATNATTSSQSIFGSAASTTAPSQSMFSSAINNTTPSQSLFNSAPNTTTPLQSVFGSATNTTMSSQSVFGSAENTTMPSPAVFGSAANATTPSQSLGFGSKTSTPHSGFGTTSGTSSIPSQGLFGTTTNANNTTSQSLFGSKAPLSTPSSGVFSSGSTSSRGNAPTTAALGFDFQQFKPGSGVTSASLAVSTNTPSTVTPLFGFQHVSKPSESISSGSSGGFGSSATTVIAANPQPLVEPGKGFTQGMTPSGSQSQQASGFGSGIFGSSTGNLQSSIASPAAFGVKSATTQSNPTVGIVSPQIGGFNFGSNAPSNNNSVPAYGVQNDKSAVGGFNFAPKQNTTNAGVETKLAFQFGQVSSTTNQHAAGISNQAGGFKFDFTASKPIADATKVNTMTSGFGGFSNPVSSTVGTADSKPFKFRTGEPASKPRGFAFGASGGTASSGNPLATTQSQVPAFGQTFVGSDSQAGSGNQEQSKPQSLFGFGAASQNSAFAFGSGATTTTTKAGGFGFTSSAGNQASQQTAPSGAFGFGAGSSESTSSAPPVTGSGMFGQPAAQSGPAFQFGASSGGTQMSGGFNFGSRDTSTPTVNFGATPATGNAFAIGATPPTFGVGAPGQAQGMFSIGSGSTAPRVRSSRQRRPK